MKWLGAALLVPDNVLMTNASCIPLNIHVCAIIDLMPDEIFLVEENTKYKYGEV
jgi:hypothetical protein